MRAPRRLPDDHAAFVDENVHWRERVPIASKAHATSVGREIGSDDIHAGALRPWCQRMRHATRGAVKERGTNRHVGRGSWSGV